MKLTLGEINWPIQHAQAKGRHRNFLKSPPNAWISEEKAKLLEGIENGGLDYCNLAQRKL